MSLPIGDAGPVTYAAEFPPGWRVHAVPTNWDASDPLDVPRREVQVGRSLVPDDFYLSIQTAGMSESAIIVRFEARSDEVVPVSITGVGDKWINHLAEVVAAFPPESWAERAEDLAVDFLRKDPVKLAAAEDVGKLPADQLPIAEVSPRRLTTEGVRRRRRITSDHLQLVARVYNGADDKPTQAVQRHFAVSHSTAAKWVGKAREEGLLPPARSVD